MQRLICALVCVLVGCASVPAPEVPDRVSLADGLYIIARSDGGSPGELRPGEVRVRYDHEFMSAEERPREVLVLDSTACVPLLLASEPVPGVSEKGFTSLQLSLAPGAKAQLEQVTRENVGRGVALLIDGRVASTHGIKEPITGGGFQLTRCNDEACQFVLVRLRAAQRKE